MNTSPIVTSIAILAMVTSSQLNAQQVERWEVAEVPGVSLGSIEDGNGDLFVNVLLGTRLSDGTLVMRNSMRGIFELRYFDPRGEHLATASRWGQGPYEFHVPAGAFRTDGDSILVVGRDGRYAVFGPRGERVRDGRFRTVGGSFPSGTEHDRGHLVFTRQWTGVEQGRTGRVSRHVIAFDAEPEQVDTIGVVYGATLRMEREGPVIAGFDQPFSAHGHVAVGGGLVWIGDSAEPTITGHRLGESGGAVSVRLPDSPRTVTRSDRRDFERRAEERWDEHMGIMWRRASRALGFPDTMPLYAELDVDRRGNLWVREYAPPWEGGAWTWMVFSPDGDQIASVEVPEAALPTCAGRFSGYCDAFLEIGHDYVLVAQRDELGVAYLRQFDIRKP